MISEKADDGIERRTQFVAHIGQKLRFCLVGVLGAGLLLGIFQRQIGELAGLLFQHLLGFAQIGDRGYAPLLALHELLLVLLELGDIGTDGDVAAILGAPFADMHPAPIVELRFERARTLRLPVLIGDGRADDDLFPGGDDGRVGRARKNRAVRQAVEFLKIGIAQNQAIVGVPQHEGFGNRLDGIPQPQIGGRRPLHQILLFGDIDRDADEMQSRFVFLARQFAAHA